MNPKSQMTNQKKAEGKKVQEESFGGSDRIALNGLMQALKDCGHDYVKSMSGNHDEYDIYAFLESSPKASLVVEIIDKLKEYGLTITHPTNE